MSVFSWKDYLKFCMTMAVPVGVGIYFGFFRRDQKSPEEYLLGGKRMKPIPIALSMITSAVSGIAMIQLPARVYMEGSLSWLFVPSLIIVCLVFSYLFLPVFYDLNLNCAYEYLELRFHRSIRSVTSVLFCVSYVLILPSIVYACSSALSLAFGINVHIISLVLTLICVFYTSVGGFRAVVWSDAFHAVLVLLSVFVIVIVGSVNVGISTVFKTSHQDGKLNVFKVEPSPFRGSTFWTVTFGTIVSGICSLASGQGYVQRFMSLPTKRDGRIALIIYCAGSGILTTLLVYGGLLIYASYYGCDPIEQGSIQSGNLIFLHFVLEKIGHVPFIPALFMAGVFGASLGALSTGLNTVAGTIYEDHLRRIGLSDFKARMVMKIIVVAIGMLVVILSVAMERSPMVMMVTYVIANVAAAPISVAFILGMTIPRANTKGALAGMLISMAFFTWITVGATFFVDDLDFGGVYPAGINTCNTSSSFGKIEQFDYDEIFQEEKKSSLFLYRLSHMLHLPVSLLSGVVVGVIVSYAMGSTDPATLDPNLISPPLRRFLPNGGRNNDGIRGAEKILLEPLG